MNATQVKDKLINDSDSVIKILEACGFHYVDFNEDKNEIRCAFDEGYNPTSILVNMDNMMSHDFGRNVSGDIFTLIEKKLNVSFKQAFKTVCNILGITNSGVIPEQRKLFGGRYAKMQSITTEDELIYDEGHMEKWYVKSFNDRFLKDGISLAVQFRYDLHYDLLSHRIIVPYYTENGLVGTTGRYNGNYEEDGVPKWLATDKFKKGRYLYGLYQNRNEIMRRSLVIVGESEKFVMQLSTMGYDYGVSTGGKNITDYQAGQLKHLAKTIILAFDEDVTEEELIEQCNKIKSGLFSNVRVGYILDKEGVILKKGSKASPTDFGKDSFNYLCKNCVKYI